MDAKLKAEWVKALRSGEYEQCNGSLTSRGKYCCLGVLNRVAKRRMNYDFARVAEIGFGPQTENVLVSMNDKQNKSFPEIADYIEANL